MIDNQIGYMICETAASPNSESTIIDQKNNRVIIETCLIDTDIKNRNGRYYPASELDPELTSERTMELLRTGNLKGENGHPMSKDLIRQQTIDPNNVVVKYLKLWKDGKNVMAYATGCQNQKGQDFDNCIRSGEKPSFSLRALGTIRNTHNGAEVHNMRIITWDRVIYPSHKAAYVKKIVSESANIIAPKDNKLYVEENDAGLLSPVTNAQVIDYIKTESANLKTIRNSFDCFYDDITLLENGKIQLCDKQGSTMIVNVENYIQNEIMNYCTKRF